MTTEARLGRVGLCERAMDFGLAPETRCISPTAGRIGLIFCRQANGTVCSPARGEIGLGFAAVLAIIGQI